MATAVDELRLDTLSLGPLAPAQRANRNRRTLQGAVAAILGLVVLRERLTRVQLLGIACTIVSVVLFSLAV